ncbi:MAG: hypothetical protein K6C11_02675, partial [Bacilli bacterium]|nr:hypothetical protein [Bacilli bacterium]
NNIEELASNASGIIAYINKEKLIDKSYYPLTGNQKLVLKKIFINLEKKKYRSVKNVFTLRMLVNYFRGIIQSFVSFLKSLVGA